MRAAGGPGADRAGAHVPEGRAAGIRRRSHRAPGSDGGPAAVSGDDRAGDIAGLRGGEEGDHGGDLAGLGGPGQQSRGAECLDAGGGGSVGQDRPGSDGIDRIPEGLNSAAQERVIAARVALVAL
jgi:hypothetical protein